jgi:hypothetical protein
MSEEFSFYDESQMPESNEGSEQKKTYDKDLYKKWFRSKTQSGFLSIRPWFQGLKLRVDIGKTSSDGKLLSSTNVFLDIVDFGAYLKAITNGTAELAYPLNDRLGVPTPEGFVSYGGAKVDGKPISRIFKAHHWQNADQSYDPNSFVFKSGHFNARMSDSGAFIPDMKNPLSVDSIKVTRQDIHSISYITDLAIISHVSNKTDWYEI